MTLVKTQRYENVSTQEEKPVMPRTADTAHAMLESLPIKSPTNHI